MHCIPEVGLPVPDDARLDGWDIRYPEIRRAVMRTARYRYLHRACARYICHGCMAHRWSENA